MLHFYFFISLILTNRMHVQVFLTATTVWYLSSYSALEVASQPARMGVIITTGRVVQWWDCRGVQSGHAEAGGEGVRVAEWAEE